MSPNERRRALALAGAAFGLAAPTAYQVQRLYEVARAPMPTDPTMILAEAHTALYWRLGTATWWAGLVALGVYAVAKQGGDHGRWARRMGHLALPLLVLLLVLAFRFP